MKKFDLSDKRIAISRTDSIGDVILTLPICAWLKQQFPSIKITFVCATYTKAIVECCSAVDRIFVWDSLKDKPEREQMAVLQSFQWDAFFHVFPNSSIAKLIKKAKIPLRVGTSHRFFHWRTCNVLENFTRKKSDLHEAQLNFSLFKKFGVNTLPSFDETIRWLEGFTPQTELSPTLRGFLNSPKKKIVLHPKSKGSAVEWPIEKFIALAQILAENDNRVYFTGTENEGLQFRNQLPIHSEIIDLSGKCSLEELITFISKCDVIIACSTGPLHIGAAVNITTIGLFPTVKPMHPGRWRPLSKKGIILSYKKKEKPLLLDVQKIEVREVFQQIQ